MPQPAIFHLLKSMGFNPEELITQLEEAKQKLPQMLASLDARFATIESKLDFIVARLQTDQTIIINPFDEAEEPEPCQKLLS